MRSNRYYSRYRVNSLSVVPHVIATDTQVDVPAVDRGHLWVFHAFVVGQHVTRRLVDQAHDVEAVVVAVHDEVGVAVVFHDGFTCFFVEQFFACLSVNGLHLRLMVERLKGRSCCRLVGEGKVEVSLRSFCDNWFFTSSGCS